MTILVPWQAICWSGINKSIIKLVMVKKKISDQHDLKTTDHNENTDNQENNDTKENVSPDKEETGQTVLPPAEGEQASEKAVSDEKSSVEKLAEMQDKYLRIAAEFDNYRRRTLREKMELSKYATENLLLSLLPIIDDFERALSHMGDGAECSAVKEGIDLIYVKFTEFMKQNGVKEIESLNCEFNVDEHHAVGKTQVEEEEKKGRIVEVVQKGYFLQDKVLRYAKVILGE